MLFLFLAQTTTPPAIEVRDPVLARNDDGSFTLSGDLPGDGSSPEDQAVLAGVLLGGDAVCADLGGVRERGNLQIPMNDEKPMTLSQRIVCNQRSR